jgi:hypothetical protein
MQMKGGKCPDCGYEAKPVAAAKGKMPAKGKPPVKKAKGRPK